MALKRKTMLHILKTPPDALQQSLMHSLSRGCNSRLFPLFEADGQCPDYEELIDLIFASDDVVCWW